MDLRFRSPLFRCRGSARYLHHAIMQSCNHVIRRISLWPLIGGEPRSPYLERRSSCVFPRRSFVSMRLMPMPRSQADRRCVCCRSRRQKVAPFSMNRACYLEERWSRQLSSIPRGNRTRVRIATRPSAWPSGPHSHLVVLSGVHGRIHSH